MVSPSRNSVALVKFPFSDLSSAKRRPALVLACAGRDDWILCQITSNPYADPLAIQISEEDFLEGGLQRLSYVRPGKLFTANATLIERVVGTLDEVVFQSVIGAVVELLQKAGH